MPNSHSSRLVRVFISSTFRDFMGERDELVKRIFPELRRRCKVRFVELLEVDLRWGITEEQSKSGETLRICLQEIDRCRPSAPVFFIGMLGERYGWIPPEDYYPKSVTEDPELGWVKQHVGGKSVTELEILHGVLNNPVMAERAFFYYRQDGYEKANWSEINAAYPFLKESDFSNLTEEDQFKQRDLKENIRNAGLTHVPREYVMPSEMAYMVLEDLWAEIDRAFPESEIPDELDRQRMEHESFAQSRIKGYVPREGLFESLDDVLTMESPAVKVVTGKSGGGKSALLAAWMKQASERLPDRTFFHFIGGTPESSTARSIVIRLMETIRAWGAVRERIPDDFGEAVQLLPAWLEKAAEGQGRGVLLVLDALDQLGSAHDQSLWWLSSDLPEGVRVVLSTLSGKSENSLKERGWLEDRNELEIQPLDEGERRDIIGSYLQRFTKKLEAQHVETLASAEQTSNALFLKVVLDELRLRGRYEELGNMMHRMLEAKNPVELFKQVLKNLEEFDKERPYLVRESLGYLAAARRGLTESELLQLLSPSENPANDPLPRSFWSPLYLALDESLVSRDGRLGFFHDFLRKAVVESYLSDKSDIEKIHGRFGDVAMSWNTHKFSPSLREYGLGGGAIHLRMAGDADRLWELLNDDGYRDAQIKEFKTVDLTAWAYKHGIDFFASKDDEESELRLFKINIKTYEMIQRERSGTKKAIKEFHEAPLHEKNRFKNAINKVFLLEEKSAVLGCLYLLADEALRRRKDGSKICREDLNEILYNLETRVPQKNDVPIFGWMEREIIASVSLEDWLRIASITNNCAQRLILAIRKYLEDGQMPQALNVIQSLANDQERIKGLGIILGKILKAQIPCDNLPVFLQSCETIKEERIKIHFLSQVACSLSKEGVASETNKLICELIAKWKFLKREYEGVSNDQTILGNLALSALRVKDREAVDKVIEEFISVVFSKARQKNPEEDFSDGIKRIIDGELCTFALILLENQDEQNGRKIFQRCFFKKHFKASRVESLLLRIPDAVEMVRKLQTRATKKQCLNALLKKCEHEGNVDSQGQIIDELLSIISSDEEDLESDQKWGIKSILEILEATQFETIHVNGGRLLQKLGFLIQKHTMIQFNPETTDMYYEDVDLLKGGLRYFKEHGMMENARICIQKIDEPRQRSSAILGILDNPLSDKFEQIILEEVESLCALLEGWECERGLPKYLAGHENFRQGILSICYANIATIYRKLHRKHKTEEMLNKSGRFFCLMDGSSESRVYPARLLSNEINATRGEDDAMMSLSDLLVERNTEGLEAQKIDLQLTFLRNSITSFDKVKVLELLGLLHERVQELTSPVRDYLLDIAAMYLMCGEEKTGLDLFENIINSCEPKELMDVLLGSEKAIEVLCKLGREEMISDILKSFDDDELKQSVLKGLVPMLSRVKSYNLAVDYSTDINSRLFRLRSLGAIGLRLSDIESSLFDKTLALCFEVYDSSLLDEEVGEIELASAKKIDFECVELLDYLPRIPILLATSGRIPEMGEFITGLESTIDQANVSFEVSRILGEKGCIDELLSLNDAIEVNRNKINDLKNWSEKRKVLYHAGISACLALAYHKASDHNNARKYILQSLDLRKLASFTRNEFASDLLLPKKIFSVLLEIYSAACIIQGYDDSLYDLYDDINTHISRVKTPLKEWMRIEFLTRLFKIENEAGLIHKGDGLFDMQFERTMGAIVNQVPLEKNRSCYQIFQFVLKEIELSEDKLKSFYNVRAEADANYLVWHFKSIDEPKVTQLPWLRNATRIYPWVSRFAVSRLRDIIYFHVKSGNLPRAYRLARECPELGLSEILAA